MSTVGPFASASLLIVGVVGVLTACPVGTVGTQDTAPVTPAPQAGEMVDLGVEAGTGILPDGGPSDAGALPRPPAVDLVVVSADGGRTAVVAADGGVGLELEPAKGIELWITPRLRTPRIRLFDWNQQLVESDDTELTPEGAVASGLGYHIELLEPLRAGRSYTLRIDSEIGPMLLDEAGTELNELRLSLKVLGEPEPKDKPRPSRKRRRR